MIYLYAYTKDWEDFVLDVAEAGQYDTLEEAEKSAQVQSTCYADDGLFFHVSEKPLVPEPNVTYFDMIQRYSK